MIHIFLLEFELFSPEEHVPLGLDGRAGIQGLVQAHLTEIPETGTRMYTYMMID